MNIAFRVDTSVEIGTGHVMRCITLADMLQDKGCTIYFFCKKVEGHLINLLEGKGFTTIPLNDSPFEQKKDAKEVIERIKSLHIDTMIIDHYHIDRTWETMIRPYTKKICVIDDLANRHHDCDMLLDQNFHLHMEERYNAFVTSSCQLFLGPQYLLLRPEFYKVSHRERREVENVLVFFGGSDPTNETMKALQAISRLPLNSIQVNVVVGDSNPHKGEIQSITEKIGANFYCQIDFLAKLMEDADLALGAGGVTMWERCFVGLPSIVTIVAHNQINSTEAASKYGAVKLAGWHEDVDDKTYEKLMMEFIQNKDALQKLQSKGYELLGKNEAQHSQGHPLVQAILYD